MNTVVLGRRTITVIPESVDIAGLSSATACVVTWNTHGLVTGDHVSFINITQADWTGLNGNSYTITRLNANSFSIPFDSSLFAAYNAGVDNGKVAQDFDVTSFVDSAGAAHAFPTGIRLSAVDLYPSAVNDVLIVREKSATGPIIMKRKDTAGGGLHKSTGGRSLKMKPYIKASEQTFNTAASVVIILEMD